MNKHDAAAIAYNRLEAARRSRLAVMITRAVPELQFQASRDRVDGLSRLFVKARMSPARPKRLDEIGENLASSIAARGRMHVKVSE